MSQVDWHSYAVHNELQIRGFFGDFRFLSNFHEQQVVYEGQVFPTNEHAFQAQKYPRERRYSCLGMTPSQVRRWGREAPLSPEQLQEWEANKLTIMLCINRSKFRNKELRGLLLATGSRYLEETNAWGDRFWGCHYVAPRPPARDKNHLGRILMHVRRELEEGQERDYVAEEWDKEWVSRYV